MCYFRLFINPMIGNLIWRDFPKVPKIQIIGTNGCRDGLTWTCSKSVSIQSLGFERGIRTWDWFDQSPCQNSQITAILVNYAVWLRTGHNPCKTSPCFLDLTLQNITLVNLIIQCSGDSRLDFQRKGSERGHSSRGALIPYFNPCIIFACNTNLSLCT